jgi:hypothetical protein
MKRDPDRIPMDRLAEYLRLFADLIGSENHPVFKGIKKASTGLKAKLEVERLPHVHARFDLIRTDSASRPAKIAAALESYLGEDGINEAQLLDSNSNVVHLFRGLKPTIEEVARVYQESTVDGVVTGMVGADDTMHLHLRSVTSQDLRFIVRDENLARELLSYFRKGILRLTVQGTWIRSGQGWQPEVNKCRVHSFIALDETPITEIFREFAKISENGWKTVKNPELFWEKIRGIN